MATITTVLRQTQEIHGRLTDEQTIIAPSTNKPTWFVPIHTHKHSDLTGLLADDHPQYLTDERASDLFSALLSSFVIIDDTGQGKSIISQNRRGSVTLRTIIAGDNITIDEDVDTLTISAVLDGGTY